MNARLHALDCRLRTTEQRVENLMQLNAMLHASQELTAKLVGRVLDVSLSIVCLMKYVVDSLGC